MATLDRLAAQFGLYRFAGGPMIHDVAPFMAERGYFVYDVAGSSAARTMAPWR